jgi:hypothetical protein
MTQEYLVLIAFACGVATDIVWAKWHAAVARSAAMSAANWSVLIFGTNIAYTVLVVERQWASVAAYAVGAWAGTFCVVRWK